MGGSRRVAPMQSSPSRAEPMTRRRPNGADYHETTLTMHAGSLSPLMRGTAWSGCIWLRGSSEALFTRGGGGSRLPCIGLRWRLAVLTPPRPPVIGGGDEHRTL